MTYTTLRFNGSLPGTWQSDLQGHPNKLNVIPNGLVPKAILSECLSQSCYPRMAVPEKLFKSDCPRPYHSCEMWLNAWSIKYHPTMIAGPGNWLSREE